MATKDKSHAHRGWVRLKKPSPHLRATVAGSIEQSPALLRSGSGGRISTHVHSSPEPTLCPLPPPPPPIILGSDPSIACISLPQLMLGPGFLPFHHMNLSSPNPCHFHNLVSKGQRKTTVLFYAKGKLMLLPENKSKESEKGKGGHHPYFHHAESHTMMGFSACDFYLVECGCDHAVDSALNPAFVSSSCPYKHDFPCQHQFKEADRP